MSSHAALGVVKAGVATLKGRRLQVVSAIVPCLLTLSCGGTGVRINCISPGQIDVGLNLEDVCLQPSNQFDHSDLEAQFDMRGMSTQLPPASLQSKEVRSRNLPFRGRLLGTNAIPDSKISNWIRTCRAANGGSKGSWLPRQWFLKLHDWCKPCGRWRSIVSVLAFSLTSSKLCLLLMAQRDEPIDCANMKACFNGTNRSLKSTYTYYRSVLLELWRSEQI